MCKLLLYLVLLFVPSLLSAALPDLAAVDKLFAEKRYAEALKGYASCEKCQIGERGYVILRSAICAERLGDEVLRTKALRKLCALDPVGKDAKYVEAAYRMRYERDIAQTLHTGDLDRFIRESSAKFRGGGFSAWVTTRELEKQLFACNWQQALKSFKAYKVQYAPGISNAVQIVGRNVLKGGRADAQSAGELVRVFAYSQSLAEHLAAHTPDGCGAWIFWDKLADQYLLQGKWDKALSLYNRASEFKDCNLESVQYKVVSMFASRPGRTDDVMARGEAFLRTYPDSKWHGHVCKMVFDALISAKRLDEVCAFVERSGLWREVYTTPEVNKALADLKRKKTEEAKRALAAKKAEKPETLDVAIRLRGQGRYAEAIAECDRIAALDRKDVPRDAARRLAARICFEDLADYQGAGERYQKLITADANGTFRKEDEATVLRIVSCLIICGKPKEAQTVLASIRPAKEDLALRNRIEALALLARPVRKSVKDTVRRMRTADVLFASGDYGVAMKEYGKVVAAKGVERECVLSARMQVARCLARLREYAKARNAYESLVKSAGRCDLSALALLRLGTIYAGALNDDKNSVRCLKRAADEYQGSLIAERAMYNLMSLYVMTGKWDEAAEARMRFLKICKTDRVRRIADFEYGRFIRNRKIE